MIRTFTILFLLVLSWQAISQSYISRIDKYVVPDTTEGTRIIVIEMPFGKPNIVSVQGDTAGLLTSTEMKIDIVCTDFPSNLSLTKLNNQRLQTLQRLFPFIDAMPEQKIEVIRQMDGAEKEHAQGMFHGIVIRYRLPQTKETMVHDLAKLKEIISEKETSPGSLKKPDSYIIAKEESKRAVPKSVTATGKDSLVTVSTLAQLSLYSLIAGKLSPKEIKELKIDTGCYKIMTPKQAVKLGYITKRDFNGWDSFEKDEHDMKIRVKREGWKHQDYITVLLCPVHSSEGEIEAFKDDVASPYRKPLPDSTIFTIFKRNKWKHMDVVGDVTGSMYPYTAQLLLWLKLQSLDSLTSDYSFFNDGNDLPDNKKRPGKTGGIYAAECQSYQQVEDLITTAMLHGSGGDAPENNVEALIDAEKQFPGNDFHVMIADNWAPLKDLKLASQLTKPVRIVLCGVYNDEINTDYLDLAWTTHGSVHLIEQDLINLASLHEGETLTIGKNEYKIVNGHFEDVRASSIKMKEL